MLLVIVFAGASYASSPLMKLEYFYAKDGTLIGRAINGARQNYEYDRRGQLLAVKDANGKDVERYIYDPVGNILSKTVTGKPHIGELGYAFLFRNYRPEQGKWQTADPLGYPDGWNNLAYVNNWITGCIDTWGTDIYHVLASGSVNGAGHSAAIVGNSTFGYRIINHGGTNTDPDVIHSWSNSYSSVAAALAALQNGRDGSELFDSIQKWETSSAQDDIAYGKMLEGATNPYSWYWNNCWQVIRDGIYEGLYPLGSLYCDDSWMPNLAYLNNYLNLLGPKSLDFNQVMQGLAE